MFTKTQAAGGGSVVVIGSGGTAAGTILIKKGNTDEITFEKTTPRVMDFIKDTPKFVVLTMDSDFDSEYGNGTDEDRTVGKKYGWYLTSIYDKDSKEWWEESYKKWLSDGGTENSPFTNDLIDSAFSSKETINDKALNKVCEKISKKIIGSGGYEDEDFFKYCSPMREIPDDIGSSGDRSNYPDGYLNGSISNLISVKNENNEIFWKLRDYEFFGKDEEDGLGANLNNEENSLFHNLYLTKETGRGSVKKVCEQAYKLDSDNTGKAKEEKVKEFCGWGNN